MKKSSMRVPDLAKSAVLYTSLVGLAFVFFFPFYYMFVIASHPRETMFRTPPNVWFGDALGENLERLLFVQEQVPYLLNYFNSIMIALLTVVTTIFFCTMGGFALAKYDFKGKKFIFLFILSTMAFPPFLNIIPFYRMMVAFGWINQWRALIVPGMANAMGIFLMRQYMEESIPTALLDAARIDGLNEFGILTRVAFPLAKPKQFVEALEYTKDVQRAFSNKRLSATGHSLGGQLALYVGGMLNIDAVAFNAPGPNARMRAEIIAAEFLNRRQGDRAISWNLSAKEALICRPKGKTTNDIVSTKLKHYGETIYVPSTITSTVSKSWLGDIRTYHAMSLMVENIDNTIENGRGGYQISIAAWNSMISAEQISSWSLPSIDFQNRTTLGGGAAPIPLPGIPSEHIVVPSTLELDSLYDFFHAKND